MTIYLRHGQGTGVIGYDTPLHPAVWQQYVTGLIYEVDINGNRPAGVATANRPLANQPDQNADTATWRTYAVNTYALTTTEASELDATAISRRLHMNPNASS